MKTALAISIVFFAGIAIGIAVGPRLLDPPTPEPADSTPAPAADVTQPAPAKLAATPEPPRPEPSVEQRSTLRAALDAIPATQYESGSGQFVGHVRTEDGKPVEGVRIRAVRKRAKGSGSGTEANLEERVLELVDQHRFRESTTLEAVTDASGAYTIAGAFETARYDVSARKTNWKFETAPGQHRHDELPGITVDFVATPQSELRVDVLFAAGGEPHKARIEYRRTDMASRRTSSSSWSPTDRSLRLEPGQYSLRARAGDDNEYASEWAETTLSIDSAASPLRLTLKTRPGIIGQVVFPPGERPENVRVFLVSSSSADVDPQVLLQSDRSDWLSHHNKFQFSFKDLEPGGYVVGMSRQHNTGVVASTFVEVTDKLERVEIEVPALGPDEYFVLWVRDPAGEIVRDFSTGITYYHGNGSHGTSPATLKKDDGSTWVLREPAADDLTIDEIERAELRIQSPKYGSKTAAFDYQSADTIEVQFVDPAFLDVTVRGLAGSDLEGRLEGVLALTEENNGARHTRYVTQQSGQGFDGDGRKRFGPVEPGEYMLHLQVRHKRHQHRVIHEERVQVGTGENAVTVPLPAVYTLTVRMPEGREKMRIQIQKSGGGMYDNGTPDESGTLVFETLGAGEYKLTSWGGPNGGQMTVRVPETLEVTFEPEEINALEVKITSAEGKLAQAGLEDGDLVVGIDGTEFESMLQMQTLFVTAMSKGSESTLMVDRGGRRLEVKLNVQAMQDPNGIGGNMEPASR